MKKIGDYEVNDRIRHAIRNLDETAQIEMITAVRIAFRRLKIDNDEEALVKYLLRLGGVEGVAQVDRTLQIVGHQDITCEDTDAVIPSKTISITSSFEPFAEIKYVPFVKKVRVTFFESYFLSSEIGQLVLRC